MPLFDEISNLPLTAPKIKKAPSATMVKPTNKDTTQSTQAPKKEVKPPVPVKAVPDGRGGKKTKPLNIPEMRKKI